MTFWAVPRLYRRAILIYVGTIVVPVAAFVWLGIQSLEGQRRTIAAQAKAAADQKLATETESAARAAFARPDHPIIEHAFVIQSGALVQPALRAPLPDRMPEEFAEAYRQEADGEYSLALRSFEALLAAKTRPSLALFGIARCLDRLNRQDEARKVWRRLAADFADDRDPFSQRPFGIIAAIAAHETGGLYERIQSGRWDLSADQAQYFLRELDPDRQSHYLARFEFAAELVEGFTPPAALADGEIYSTAPGGRRIFYRSDGPNRITGFAVNESWIAETLRPRIERDLDVEATTRKDVRLYVGSVGLVLMVLSAGVVLLLRDVSREARTNQARAELVSSVSHELKTPITLMRLYSETLLRHPGFSDEDRHSFYRIIARESTRLGRLIDQVLTFSRVDRGAQVYHFEEGDLASVVTGVVEDYREYLEHAGFSLRHTVPDVVPPVRFDGAAISQALLNLLDNAVKYSGTSKHIGVRIALNDGHVAVEVEDHGVGIPPSEQERVFDRFYRVKNGSDRGGYGLGLFLVRRIMEAHGGRAEVDSAPGRGSRFRLVLPAVAA